MTSLSKVKKELSKNVLPKKAKGAVKGGTCLPPSHTGKTSYHCYKFKIT